MGLKLTIDFETRSRVDLRKTGAFAYAEDPSTEVMCLAIKVDDQPTRLWIPRKFLELFFSEENLNILDSHEGDIALKGLTVLRTEQVEELIQGADIIEAHNAGFERAIWENVCVNRMGWPEIPVHKWRCTASRASAMALPRSLGEVCKVLGLSEQKSNEGHQIMLKLCKPRTPTKNNPAEWHETASDLLKLFTYCAQDVEAEHALSEAISELIPSELEMWQLDQEINARGVYVDVPTARQAKELIEAYKTTLEAELKTLTHGMVGTAKQVGATRQWFLARGVDLPDLTAPTVTKALTREDITGSARRVLEIRKQLGGSATSKYDAIIKRACKDGRARDTLMYCGAERTARWAGRGIQPHNMPRGDFKDPALCIETIQSQDIGLMKVLFGDPMSVMSTAIRGMLRAAPGKDLICADYSAIEGRGLAWLAGEEHVLEGYRAKLDPYKTAATGIYEVKYEDVDKAQRQVGKVSELALGYQGGYRAYMSMASNYGVTVPPGYEPETEEEWMENGKRLTLEEACFKKWATPIVYSWRDARPKTLGFWNILEDMAIKAVETGGAFTWRNLLIGCKGDYLHIKLPSGRLMSYYKPLVEPKKTPWGAIKNVVTYMGIYNSKWVRLSTYGGKLAENITQAVCRDILAEGIKNVTKAGYPVVLHVHDEIVAEVDKGQGDLAEFEELMAKDPAWAAGFPLTAKGWRGKRYRK